MSPSPSIPDPDSGPSVRRRALGAALLLTASTLLSRVLGWARDAIVAAQHGADQQTDVYFASFTLPDLMSYMLAGGALSITFVPMATRAFQEGGQAAVDRVFSVVATTMAVVLTLAIAVAWALAPILLPALLPGFTPDALAETVTLTRIVLPAQLFFYVGGLLGATVMARTRFLEVALAPLVYNVAIILGGVLLGPWLGLAGFSWGALVGAALGPFALVAIAARRSGLGFTPRLALADPDFLRFVKVSLPVMAGFSLVTVDEWITRYFASSLPAGSISWVQNARRLMLVPVSVLGQAAGQAALPFLARLRAEGKSDEAGRVLHDALSLVAFLTLVASAGLVALAVPGVSAFYERGAFTATDTAATAAALVPMGLGVVFWALQALGARGFYATGDTLTPMTLATVATVISLPVYAWLAGQAGHVGLAWGTTIGMALTAGLTLTRLSSRFPYEAGRLAIGMARSAAIAGLAGLAAWATAEAIPATLPARVWLQLAAGGAVLAAVTLMAGLALGSPEVGMVLRRLRRR